MAGKLTWDPGGSPTNLTLTGHIRSLVVEQAASAPRQTIVSGGYVQTRALSNGIHITGTLVLGLTPAERITVQAQMADLMGGQTLRVFPDSTVGGTYTDVVVAGEVVTVEYEFTAGSSQPWTLSLPVREA